MNWVVKIFDRLSELWDSKFPPRLISTILIISFSVTFVITLLVKYLPIPVLTENAHEFNLFLPVNVSFTVLLIFEILGLLFVLPKSVADSMGKQFEILSIILLRSAFKEFGHFSENILNGIQYDKLYPMMADAFGALIIFLIIGFYYKKQKHERITKSNAEQQNFIAFKKLLALFLLLAFLIIGVWDIGHAFIAKHYIPSFNAFYTLLIFSDILILFYSLRYHSKYINLFRYSSYAFATILIRISLSASSYTNVILGVLAGAFVLVLTLAYNSFREEYG